MGVAGAHKLSQGETEEILYKPPMINNQAIFSNASDGNLPNIKIDTLNSVHSLYKD